MAMKANRISTDWIRETREQFRDFLDETNFLDPERPLLYPDLSNFKSIMKNNCVALKKFLQQILAKHQASMIVKTSKVKLFSFLGLTMSIQADS